MQCAAFPMPPPTLTEGSHIQQREPAAETRSGIKEAALAQQRRVAGVAVCQAVVYDDVRSLEESDR
jgi:hypothetical protein